MIVYNYVTSVSNCKDIFLYYFTECFTNNSILIYIWFITLLENEEIKFVYDINII